MITKYDLNYFKNQIIAICKDIDASILKTNFKGLNPDVIQKLRHLLDSTFPFLYLSLTKSSFETADLYGILQKSRAYIKKNCKKCDFLFEFYDSLQVIVSHYTISDDEAFRLSNKYICFLIKYKFLLKQFKLNILLELNEYPLNLDKITKDYYTSILDCFNSKIKPSEIKEYQFYILNKKTVFINEQVFFEYTLSNCFDKIDKADNFTAYSKLDILENYCVKCKFVNKNFKFLSQNNNLMLIVGYDIHIRPCEFQHFGWILFGPKTTRPSTTLSYKFVMDFIKDKNKSLAQIVIDNDLYNILINGLKKIKARNNFVLQVLKQSHSIVTNRKKGYKTILYLLCSLNNSLVKDQKDIKPNIDISDLYIKGQIMIFEKTPFTGNLCGHKTNLGYLHEIFNFVDFEDEIFANAITTKSNNMNQLYHKLDKIDDKILDLIKKYNFKVNRDMQIKVIGKNVCISSFEENTINILNTLLSMKKPAIYSKIYKKFANNEIKNENFDKDDSDKIKAITNTFGESNLMCIYGAAGTGKTKLISMQLSLFKRTKFNILCLANTHTALENLKNNISNQNVEFKTASSFVKSNSTKEYDILVLDECTCVSSRLFWSVLQKINPKLIILAGDIYQIDSIEFGNWFNQLKYFLDNNEVTELSNQYRTEMPVLVKFWDEVRSKSNKIKELLAKYKISRVMDKTIFDKSEDSIILCLNYNGPYGINNINNILQSNNPNPAFYINNKIFKKDDPIIFNSTNRFWPILHNNLKGKIIDIKQKSDSTTFNIEVYKNIIDTGSLQNIRIKDVLKNNHTIVEFDVKHSTADQNDIDSNEDYLVPFHISYATSIHKAQGLEYKNVKIIITDEISERITHNVFYTAITRAKENLTIYWSPAAEDEIINNFKIDHSSKYDNSILKTKIK